MDPYIALVVTLKYASFHEATMVMDTEQLFDCVEVAMVHLENERRQHAAMKRETDRAKAKR